MFVVYKKIGETPLACLKRTRKEQNIAEHIPMTYAGRLDPMAEGLLVLLVGDECKEKPAWTGLSKTYEFDILVGFNTDTNDLLGLVDSTSAKISGLREKSPDTEIFADLKEVLPLFLGEQIQTYPKYSSKPVNGTPLFLHTRNGTEVELPTHTIQIDELYCRGVSKISALDLKKTLHERIALIQGDFRQEEILHTWDSVLGAVPHTTFEIIHCTVSCSSGTYVRQLVADMSEKLQIPLVTFSIKRTKIGEYSLDI